MSLRSVRATFMRGGTSKALVFRAADLPADRGAWDAIFLAAMGSPDPNGRQLDGMGGGLSSLSKVCVVGPPSRADADVDFTFAQIAIDAASVDYAGTCGNMSSAIGPFAIDEGLVPLPPGDEATVRVHNTNTGRVFVARFPLEDGRSAVDGTLALDGVAGTAAPIRLDFLDPAGAKTGALLPSGHATDVLDVPGVGAVRATLIDAGNPFVHVAAADVGARGEELPAELERDAALLARLEAIRRSAAVAMGLAPDHAAAARIVSIPKIAMLSAPRATRLLDGRTLRADDADVVARTISVGQPHRAIPLTGALCLAVAARVPGSIAHALARATAPDAPLRIAHPSGTIIVAADVRAEAGALRVPSATVYRTARRLFAGEVYYRAAVPALV
ncbi:MAG TPA: PrpF domain-containing protein [Candidatus Sulfotelmatobacter sp.]|nr:PrpF domain-containing protein [Candidatus Sulfotelmatobacter sp.]